MFAVLDSEMMSPRVEERRIYLCEETLTNRSEIYFSIYLFKALYTRSPVWSFNLLSNVSHLRLLNMEREGVP